MLDKSQYKRTENKELKDIGKLMLLYFKFCSENTKSKSFNEKLVLLKRNLGGFDVYFFILIYK